MELSQTIKRACRRYESVEAEGLTLYPILVEEIELFEMARPSIDIVQQSLPVAYAAMPLLAAYYEMEYRAQENGEEPIGLFASALLMLVLSLRLGKGLPAEERMARLRLSVDREHPEKLRSVDFTLNGEEMCRVTPVQFQRLREIIAAQNGIELVSEDANPELIQAERDLAEMNGVALKGGLADRIGTIAALCHAEEDEIDGWPILKLQNREKAWRRITGYLVCGIAEAQGTKWRGGNPHPSLFYEKADVGTSAVRPVESVTQGMEQRS